MARVQAGYLAPSRQTALEFADGIVTEFKSRQMTALRNELDQNAEIGVDAKASTDRIGREISASV